MDVYPFNSQKTVFVTNQGFKNQLSCKMLSTDFPLELYHFDIIDVEGIF